MQKPFTEKTRNNFHSGTAMEPHSGAKVRYAVIGLGHIAQTAVLPAFRNAKKNSELSALVSTNPVKLEQLGRKYKVKSTYTEDRLEECLESGEIDALYIATPNSTHQRYAEAAIRHGIHVLCEKPLTTDEASARSLLSLTNEHAVKFMVAYRLHFDAANLKAVEIAQCGKLGELRLFNSVFTMDITDKNNIRLQQSKGGGPLFDIGIYCINAARYLFRDEPLEVTALSSAPTNDERFYEVDEMISVCMRFPKERLAQFLCSFGAAEQSYYQLIGTKGSLQLNCAYDYASKMDLHFQSEGKTTRIKYPQHDQFGPELLYFSNCILNDLQPEPSIIEGLADILTIEAIEESCQTGTTVKVSGVEKKVRPLPSQKIHRAPVAPFKLIHATSPTAK